MSSKPVAAVVLGETGLLRCLGALRMPCFVVACDKDHVAFSSRYCQEGIIVPSFAPDCQETLDILLSLGRRLGNAVIVCNGEPDLLFVSRHREALSKYYRQNLPDPSLIATLVDKGLFHRVAKQHGMPVPETWQPQDGAELEEVIGSLEFPCIVKPTQHAYWSGEVFDQQFGSGTKALVVRSARELRSLYFRLRAIHPDLLIQEYVHGRDDQLYFVDAYFDRQGRPRAYFVGHRIRTYPIYSGLTTLGETVHSSQLASIALTALDALGYRGAAHVDFKVDARDGSVKLLEVNPRFGMTIDLGAASGVNLPAILYRDLTQPQPMGTARHNKDVIQMLVRWPPYRAGVKWVDVKHDIKALLAYRVSGEWTVGSWMRSFGGPRMYRHWSVQDPGPFATSVATVVQKQAQRALQRFGSKAPRMLWRNQGALKEGPAA